MKGFRILISVVDGGRCDGGRCDGGRTHLHKGSDPSSAQPQPKVLVGKSATIAVSLTLPKKQITVGETPWALLTVTNLGNEEIAFPKDRLQIVDGENDEPPTTLRQRQLTHQLRPGERQLREGGFEPSIEPHESSTRKYDLSLLYDLSKPGRYTVYIEVLDVSAPETKHDAGLWVRSNTVQIEIQPSSLQ